MGKRQRKIEAIKKYISNAGGNWPAYSYGNIPRQKAINACNAYAGAVQPDSILGLIDTTIMGNGKKGMVFTEYKVYYDNGMLGNRGGFSYKEILEEGIPTEVLNVPYNGQAVRELLIILAHIEEESIQKSINNVNSTLDSLNQGVQNVSCTIDKAVDLLDNVLNLFGGNKKE